MRVHRFFVFTLYLLYCLVGWPRQASSAPFVTPNASSVQVSPSITTAQEITQNFSPSDTTVSVKTAAEDPSVEVDDPEPTIDIPPSVIPESVEASAPIESQPPAPPPTDDPPNITDDVSSDPIEAPIIPSPSLDVEEDGPEQIESQPTEEDTTQNEPAAQEAPASEIPVTAISDVNHIPSNTEIPFSSAVPITTVDAPPLPIETPISDIPNTTSDDLSTESTTSQPLSHPLNDTTITASTTETTAQTTFAPSASSSSSASASPPPPVSSPTVAISSVPVTSISTTIQQQQQQKRERETPPVSTPSPTTRVLPVTASTTVTVTVSAPPPSASTVTVTVVDAQPSSSPTLSFSIDASFIAHESPSDDDQDMTTLLSLILEFSQWQLRDAQRCLVQNDTWPPTLNPFLDPPCLFSSSSSSSTADSTEEPPSSVVIHEQQQQSEETLLSILDNGQGVLYSDLERLMKTSLSQTPASNDKAALLLQILRMAVGRVDHLEWTSRTIASPDIQVHVILQDMRYTVTQSPSHNNHSAHGHDPETASPFGNEWTLVIRDSKKHRSSSPASYESLSAKKLPALLRNVSLLMPYPVYVQVGATGKYMRMNRRSPLWMQPDLKADERLLLQTLLGDDLQAGVVQMNETTVHYLLGRHSVSDENHSAVIQVYVNTTWVASVPSEWLLPRWLSLLPTASSSSMYTGILDISNASTSHGIILFDLLGLREHHSHALSPWWDSLKSELTAVLGAHVLQHVTVSNPREAPEETAALWEALEDVEQRVPRLVSLCVQHIVFPYLVKCAATPHCVSVAYESLAVPSGTASVRVIHTAALNAASLAAVVPLVEREMIEQPQSRIYVLSDERYRRAFQLSIPEKTAVIVLNEAMIDNEKDALKAYSQPLKAVDGRVLVSALLESHRLQSFPAALVSLNDSALALEVHLGHVLVQQWMQHILEHKEDEASKQYTTVYADQQFEALAAYLYATSASRETLEGITPTMDDVILSLFGHIEALSGEKVSLQAAWEAERRDLRAKVEVLREEVMKRDEELQLLEESVEHCREGRISLEATLRTLLEKQSNDKQSQDKEEEEKGEEVKENEQKQDEQESDQVNETDDEEKEKEIEHETGDQEAPHEESQIVESISKETDISEAMTVDHKVMEALHEEITLLDSRLQGCLETSLPRCQLALKEHQEASAQQETRYLSEIAQCRADLDLCQAVIAEEKDAMTTAADAAVKEEDKEEEETRIARLIEECESRLREEKDAAALRERALLAQATADYAQSFSDCAASQTALKQQLWLLQSPAPCPTATAVSMVTVTDSVPTTTRIVITATVTAPPSTRTIYSLMTATTTVQVIPATLSDAFMTDLVFLPWPLQEKVEEKVDEEKPVVETRVSTVPPWLEMAYDKVRQLMQPGNWDELSDLYSASLWDDL